MQLPYAKRVLNAMGVHTLECAGYEADDILGTLARLCDESEDTEGYILTGDRDLLQLIDDKITVLLASNSDTSEVREPEFYEKYGYLADTHTSVALCCAEKYVAESNDDTKIIVASTASPYKFAADVYHSLTEKEASADTGALDDLSTLTKTEITYPLRDLDKREIRFSEVIDSDAMLEAVYKFM